MLLRKRWWLAACALVVIVVMVIVLAERAEGNNSTQPVVVPTTTQAQLPPTPDLSRAEAYVAEVHAVGSYLAWRAHQDAEAVGSYLGWRAEQDALVAYLASLPPPPPPRRYSAPTQQQAAPQQQASGDCYSGSPVPAYIINRESGGNPNAVNPSSGTYGCYQEQPFHFAAGGACAGLNMYSLADQKACAWNLYNAGGLSPWAETR